MKKYKDKGGGMKVICGGRGAGKTYRLVQKIKKEGGVLLTFSEQERRRILLHYGLKANQVLSYENPEKLKGLHTTFLIDNIEFLLQRYLGYIDVDAISLTGKAENLKRRKNE